MPTTPRKYTPFLKSLAQYFTPQEDLRDTCFVFPNRRSGQFFERELQIANKSTMMLPKVTTISDFVADVTGELAVPQVEALFVLYQAYCELIGNTDFPFDKFVYWGSVVLTDFDDVDMYMVDASALFTNVKEFKEISTDFLSDEVKQMLERFFNVTFKPSDPDVERFWKADNVDDDGVKAKFFSLWRVLYNLYIRYGEKLAEQKLSYRGKMYKDAALKLRELPVEELRYKKYVFAGFNVLSTSEISIFDSLKKKGVAQFFWDYNSPAFAPVDGEKESHNKATKFLGAYVGQFPPPSDFTPDEVTDFPELHTVAIASQMGQAKCAFNIVDQLVGKHIVDSDNAIDTAIVLPDENLFMPLLSSMSNQVGTVNVTLGYKLRNADIASLIRVVARAHKQASHRDGDAGNQYYFYREDVKNVLSHPLIKNWFAADTIKIVAKIDYERLFHVPESLFAGTELEDIFTSGNIANCEEAVKFLTRLENFATKIRSLTDKLQVDEDDDDSKSTDAVMPLQSAFISQYIDVLRQLRNAISAYGIPMTEDTIFYLIDRLASPHLVPFHGEPLAGLQIMGMLETRCLDFRNIIILSMNERIFPRKFFAPTFIAEALRRYFGMATIEHQEAMTAYYFYRLISRAERVYMIYDSGSSTIGSNEPSRFIEQLKKVYGRKVENIKMTMGVKPSNGVTIRAPKNDRVMAELNAFLDKNKFDNKERAAHLSASALKKYLKCPLSFYFRYVEHLGDSNETTDFMDAGTFGTIVHDTLQSLYYPEGSKGTQKVTYDYIKSFQKDKLEGVIIKQVNKTYLHRGKDDLNKDLEGETLILLEALKIMVNNVLYYDLNLLGASGAFFEVYECEVDTPVRLKVEDMEVNFTFKADRIDRINGEGPLRIIDYKTGKDKTSFTNVDELFEPGKTDDHLAIFQLMLYCNAYKQKYNYEGEIQPVIYSIKDMKNSGVKWHRAQKDIIQLPHFEYVEGMNEKFCNTLYLKLQNLFNKDNAFVQAPEGYLVCNYCHFMEFCRRQKEEKNYK